MHDAPDLAGRSLTLSALVGVVVLVAIHLWVGRELRLPARGFGVPGDQWGYLGNARYLAASGPTWILPNFPYFSYGYSLALVPAFRLFDDPESLFFAIRVTNAVLAAAVFPLVALFLRRVLELARGPSVFGGFMAALVPGAIAHSSSPISENLVLPLVVASALACWLSLTVRPSWQRLLLGPSVAALIVTHSRFVLAFGVMVLILAVAVIGRSLPRWIAVVNVVIATGVLLVASFVRARLVDARWVDGIDTPQGPAPDALEVFADWSSVGQYLLAVVGQLWYVAVGTLGVGLLGLIALSSALVGARGQGHGVKAWLSALGADARRLTLTFVIGRALGVLVVSSYFFFRVTNGSEGFIAGRHNDSFVPIWVGVGTAFVTTSGVRRRAPRAVAVAVGIVIILAATLVLVRDRSDWDSLYSILNVPAVFLYTGSGVGVILTPTAIALGTLIIIGAVVLADRTTLLVLLLIGAWMVVSVARNVDDALHLESWDFPQRFAELDIERAAIVQGRNSGVPIYYPYFLPELVPWDGSGRPPERYVMATVGETDVERFGGRLVLVDQGVRQGFEAPYDVGVWIMPDR